MKATVRGKIIGANSYYSKKKGREVYELDLYDGREVIRVSDVPEEYYRDAGTDDIGDMPVRIYPGNSGLFIVYDAKADQAG